MASHKPVDPVEAAIAAHNDSLLTSEQREAPREPNSPCRYGPDYTPEEIDAIAVVTDPALPALRQWCLYQRELLRQYPHRDPRRCPPLCRPWTPEERRLQEQASQEVAARSRSRNAAGQPDQTER